MGKTNFTPDSNAEMYNYAGGEDVKTGRAFARAADTMNSVEKLTPANAHRFLGISSRDKTGRTGNHPILVEHPGASSVKAAVLQNFAAGAVVGALVSSNTDANGLFAYKGKAGIGSVMIKEAVTDILIGNVGNATAVTATTSTNGKDIIFAGTAVPSTVVAGSKVMVIAAATVAGPKPTALGEYIVESTTSSTITVTEAIFAAATKISCAVYRHSVPTAKVDILFGDVTGCIQVWDGTEDVTPSGLTLLAGGVALTADHSVTVPTGGIADEKTFALTAAVTTSEYLIGENNSLSSAAGVALDSVNLAGATDVAYTKTTGSEVVASGAPASFETTA